MKEETLQELGFNNIDQDGLIAWSKMYKGFILFIAKHDESYQWYSCIKVGAIEISIPNMVDEEWVIEFDKENS